MERGDRVNGALPKPADRQRLKKQVVLCEHELPGSQARSTGLPAEPHRRLARSSARRARAAELDVTHLVVEHEYPKARIQDKEKLKPILAGSIAFTRKIDEAAACMYALQHEVLKAQGIPIQGRGRQAYST
jgi:hypothetical protein